MHNDISLYKMYKLMNKRLCIKTVVGIRAVFVSVVLSLKLPDDKWCVSS